MSDNRSSAPAVRQEEASPSDLPIDQMPITWRTLHVIKNTPMVPKAYRKLPEKQQVPALLAAALMGREVGLPVLEAWQRIDIIDGEPQWSAEYLLERIRSAGHRIYPVEFSPTEVRLRCQRWNAVVGEWEEPIEIPYTWEEAHNVVVSWKGSWKASASGKRYFAKEYDANGDPVPESRLTDKDNWRNYPVDMLFWRAVTRAARWIFSDCLHGLRYLPDEKDPGVWPGMTASDAIDSLHDSFAEDEAEDAVEAEIVEGSAGEGDGGEAVTLPADDDSPADDPAPESDEHTEKGDRSDLADKPDDESVQPSTDARDTEAGEAGQAAGSSAGGYETAEALMGGTVVFDPDDPTLFDSSEILTLTPERARERIKLLASTAPDVAAEGTVADLQAKVSHVIELVKACGAVRPDVTVQNTITLLHENGHLSTSDDDRYAESPPTPGKIRKEDWQRIVETWWRFIQSPAVNDGQPGGE